MAKLKELTNGYLEIKCHEQ